MPLGAMEKLKHELAAVEADCDEFKAQLENQEDQYNSLLCEKDEWSSKYENSKAENNRPQADFILAKLDRVTGEFDVVKAALDGMREKWQGMQDERDRVTLKFSRAQEESAFAAETGAQSADDDQKATEQEARQEVRLEREASLAVARQKTMDRRTKGLLENTTVERIVSQPGTQKADRIAHETYVGMHRQICLLAEDGMSPALTKHQHGVMIGEKKALKKRERQDEREAAELAEWEADEKRRKDLQDFHQDFAENKKYLAAQARIREVRLRSEKLPMEEFERETREQGLSVTHEKLKKQRADSKELHQTMIAAEQDMKKSVLLDKLTQEKQLARLRNETAEHEHWHDRLAIQTSTYPSVKSPVWYLPEKAETSDEDDEDHGDHVAATEPAAAQKRAAGGFPKGHAYNNGKKAQQREENSMDSTAMQGDNIEMPPSFTLAMGEKEEPSCFETYQVARMEKVFQTLKEPIFEDQNVAGRHYKGPGFSWKPSVILFKDFEINKVYKQSVLITNISYTHNVCRMVGISADIADFVTAKFTPIEHISAGMTCNATVTFVAKIDKDLTGSVNFISETGRFGLPVLCRRKKREITSSATSLNFGTMVVAESQSKTITLKNDGALDTTFSVERVEYRSLDSVMEGDGRHGDDKQPTSMEGGDSVELQPSESLIEFQAESQPALDDIMIKTVSASEMDNDGGIDVDNKDQSGVVKGYGQKDIHFHFRPATSGDFVAMFRVSLVDANVNEVLVHVEGHASDLPVCVDRDNVDLKICTLDFQYQDDLILRNSNSASCSFTVDVPKSMKDHLDILPVKGVVQAQSTFPLWVKFHAKESLLCSQSPYFNIQTRRLRIPIVIKINQLTQTIPVHVEATVSTSDLSFNGCEKIDFGTCSVFSRTAYSLPVSNDSLCVQSYGFVGLPGCIQVQPGNGFGDLLPGETRNLEVIYSPDEPGVHTFTLTCRTLQNRSFLFRCTAVAHLPPLKLSHGVLEFRPTWVGNTSAGYIDISNPLISKSSTLVISGLAPKRGSRRFSFSVPDNVPIEVTPMTGLVKPGQKARVSMTFVPQLKRSDIINKALCTVNAAITERNKAVDSAKLLAKTSGKSLLSASQRSKALVKSKSDQSKDMSGGESSSAPLKKQPLKKQPLKKAEDILESSEEYDDARLALLRQFETVMSQATIKCSVSGIVNDTDDVDTSTLKAVAQDTLYLDVSMLTLRPGLIISNTSHSRQLDFGQAAVGSVNVLNIIVENLTNTTINTTSSPLGPLGPFSFTESSPSLEPGGKKSLGVRFAPTQPGEYADFITVMQGADQYQMKVVGQAIHATFIVTPENTLDFGNLLVGETSEKSIEVKNTSQVPVTLSADLLESGTGKVCSVSAQTPFRCLSVRPVLNAGEKTSVDVQMLPCQPALCAAAKLLLKVCRLEVNIAIVGSSWTTPMYVSANQLENSYRHPTTDAFLLQPHTFLNLNFFHCSQGNKNTVNKNRIDIQSMKSSFGKSSCEFSFGTPRPSSLAGIVSFDPSKGTSEKAVTAKMAIPADQIAERVVEVVVPLVFKTEGGGTQTIQVILRSQLLG